MASAAASSAIILAGGRNSRMGRPKAALEFDGRALLSIIVDKFRRRFAEIVIVAAPESARQFDLDLRGVTIVRDEVPFAGPLDALRRGLDAIANDRAFACGCDLPLLDADAAAAIVAMLEDFDAVIPKLDGRLEPLHAAYRKRSAGAFAALAARGEKRLGAIADAARVKIIGPRELRAIDPGLRSFFNLNTPADYARALRLAKTACKRTARLR